MQPFLRDMDVPQLVAAFTANKLRFAARLSELPGATAGQASGLTWVDSGIPLATFNGVDHATLTEDEAAASIAAVVAHFRKRGLPFHWGIGPEAQPAMPAQLIAHGFAFDETEPAMAADLHALDETLPPVADLTIVPVTTAAQVTQWVQTWGCGAPRFITNQWQTVYQGLWQRIPPAEFILFLAMRGDEPVGTVYLYCHAGVAAVHYVVTPSTLRRQGIGATLTRHALQQARAAGY
ncbi:MAG: GNAT family N-acetyltransferase, partial [Ktedonobacterales bacterium]|nr:GNAT family N-acetyltransferase [Ktedonobacterales bacterium]